MKILLLVDCQNDFMPGGALPVPGGNEIVPIINSIRDKFDKVIWTKDWHPANHSSFIKNGGPWPIHCVQTTPGSDLHKDLILDKHNDEFVFKGLDPSVDSYSGFFDNERRFEAKMDNGKTFPFYLSELSQMAFLHEGKNPRLYVCGLATNFCVKFTVLDSLMESYETYVILDACRGIDINPGDIQKAQEDMVDAGALITSSKAILKW
jgi:nicotinamidase/pyrazinamidase